GTVGGKIYTNNATGVTPSTLCNTVGKCVRGAGSTTAPPTQPFPVINWDATAKAAWEAAGYTVVTVSPDTCTNASNWIAANASSITTPTLLRSACTTPLDIDLTIRLKTDLAIVADGGFAAKNGADYASFDATLRYFQLIQPYNTPLAPTCAVDGIYFKNNASTASIGLLLYTPCDVEFKNNSTMYGQIYSNGNVYFKQHGGVGYRPVPAFGIVGGTVASFDVDVLFKREEPSS
ncbi:MAG: hypothetical protein QOH57_4176, partial [Mycobacterium sp.]|nr:hypothetical protein [Mycobacterium sp.]